MGDDHKNIAQELGNLVKAFQTYVDLERLEFEYRKSCSGLATKQDLQLMEIHIMSAISESVAKLDAFFDRQDAAITALSTSIDGVSADVAALNAEILKLQNSTGAVTPEDQASIDRIQTRAESVAARLEGASAALGALDAMTPPVVPVP